MKIIKNSSNLNLENLSFQFQERYINDTGFQIPIYSDTLDNNGVTDSWSNKTNQHDIVDQIEQKIKPFIVEYAGDNDCVLYRAWISIHDIIVEGKWADHAPEHNHWDVDFTSIFYVSVPEDSGNLFIEINDQREIITPEKNDLVILDGDTCHSTGPNLAKERRVTLVCDWLKN